MEFTVLELIVGSVLVPAVTFVAGLFTGRRKSRAESRALELENVEREIDLYRSVIQDHEKHSETQRAMNDELRSEVKDLLVIIQPLRKRVTHLEEKVEILEEENLRLRKKQVDEA